MLEGSCGAKIAKQDYCRPDPEEMLQRARRDAEACDKLTDNIMAAAEVLPGNLSGGGDNALINLLGSIVIRRYRAMKEITYYLKQIDRDAKK